jgi:proteasome lid subunit RPN8/RPN11
MLPGILGEPFANKDTKLSIDGKVVKRLFSEGKEALPYEYSALLAGNGASITRHFPAPAAGLTMHSFAWDGPALFSALAAMHKEGTVWLGVLHTHPHSLPVPSQADIAGWHYPALSYWILSFPSGLPDLRVYQLAEGGFVRRAYEILPPLP